MSSFQVIFIFVLAIWESSVALTQGSCSSQRSSVGKEFIFGLIDNFSTSNVKVNIAAETPGRVWIRALSVGINKHYLINAGTDEIIIPTNIIQKTNNTIENKTIHIKSDTDISVSVTVSGSSTYEGFLAFPVSNASNRFVIPSEKPYSTGYPSEILIAASFHGTKVFITFPEDLTGSSIANNTINITLNEHQTFQFKDNAHDLSGTYIHSSGPISVVAGNRVARIPAANFYGNLIMEQIPPVDYFGEHFIVPPLSGRLKYMIRILAVDNHILVTLQNTTGLHQFMLYRDMPITLYNENHPVYISSQRPVLVTQYSLSYQGNSRGGEFMWIIPSISNFMTRYEFLVPAYTTTASNYICIIVSTEEYSNVMLDTASLRTSSRLFINTTEGNFTVLTSNVTAGKHSITTKSGNTVYGALLYGYFQSAYAGYGFPLGLKANDKGCKTTLPTMLSTESPTRGLAPSVITSIAYHTTTYSGIQIGPALNGTGIYCFDCQEASHLYLCNTVKRCQSSEICSMAMYRTSNGFVKYRAECMDKKICSSTEHRRDTQSVDCSECCTGHFCNNQGCDSQGLPDRSIRGPMCFDCQHVHSVEECGTVTLCNRDQICSIQELHWGELKHFSMGCASNQCIPVKRSTPICQSCCSKDYCNHSCGSSSTFPAFG